VLLKVEIKRKINNFMDTKNLENKIETLIIIELLKLGASRDQVREIIGSLNNERFAKINSVMSKKK